MYICIYTNMYIYIYTYICIYKIHKHTYVYTHLCISVPSALLHVHITQISRLCTLDFFSFPPQVSPLSHQLSYMQFASS